MSDTVEMKKGGAYASTIEKVVFEDLQLRRAYSDYLATRNVLGETGKPSMAELATTPLRFFRQRGRMDKLDKPAEDGAAAVKINVRIGDENEPWLLMIKSSDGIDDCMKKIEEERVNPYAAVRVTAAADPTKAEALGEGAASSLKLAEEFADKLRALGIAAGSVEELYHPVYEAGRMESCAVLAAVPAVDLALGDGSDEEDQGKYTAIAADEDGNKDKDKDVPALDEAEGISINFRAAADWKRSPLYDESLSFSEGMRRLAEDLNVCSKRGLSDRFDSTVGSGTVLMPLGGQNQLTPAQAAVNKIPTPRGNTDDCSLVAWGFNPYIFDASPYHAAYLAVVESVSKLVASGASFNEVYLALQQNFGPAEEAGRSCGKQLAALLGVFEAEMGLGICSVGGDAVYEKAGHGKAGDAPSLILFAMTMGKASEICSSEFKGRGHRVVMLSPDIDEDEQSAYFGLPNPKSLIAVWRKAYELIANGKAVAAYAPGIGGIAEAVMKMSYGNGIGFSFESEEGLDNSEIFGYSYGSIILEMASEEPVRSRSVDITVLGHTTDRHVISRDGEAINIGELLMLYEGRLESVFPTNADSNIGALQNLNYAARSWPTPIYKRAVPKWLIPVFGATSGAHDAARAAEAAGGAAEILELCGGVSGGDAASEAERFAKALSAAQILCLAGGTKGLSGEIVKIFKGEAAQAAVREFLDKRDGLILGLGGGFKALLELGLLPGSLAGNKLGAYQSRIARVRVASNKSPWFRDNKPGEVLMLPVSCIEGRFEASDELLKKLAVNGQIATQFADSEGRASSDIRFNPGGSMMAVESITSEDGRVLGRIGCADRVGRGLYRNVPGNYFSGMFENAMRYFR